MQVKDYYAILKLSPTATPIEIKKAYRSLAMQYHPDKTKNDPYALAQFNEIKEAYEVLMHPAKKEAYLQERWLYQFSNKKFDQTATTPPELLKQCIALNREIAMEDRYRMNHAAYAKKIAALLTVENIAMLQHFDDAAIRTQIFRMLLAATQKIPLALLPPLMQQFKQLAAENHILQQEASNLFRKRKQLSTLEKYEWLWVVLLTVLICWIIFASVR